MASTLTEALQQQNLQNSGGAPAAGFHAPPATLTQALQQQNAVAMPAQGVMADLPPQFAPPATLSLGQVFSSRLMEGVDQTQQMGGAVMRMLGRSLGSATIETFGQNIIEGNQAEIEMYAPSVHSLGEIENFDDFLEWAVGGFGQAIPSLATALAGGGVGSVIGRQVIKRRIAKEFADGAMGRLAARGMGKKEAQAAIDRALRDRSTAKLLKEGIQKGIAKDLRRGTMIGGGAGTFTASSTLMTGEAEMAGVTDPLLAIGVGVTGGILETAVLGRFVSRLFPGVDKKVSHNFIKDFAKGTGTQALLEGSQEGAQELIQQAALAFHDPSFDFMDPQNAMQVIDSFAIGALVGTVMGAGAEAVGQTTRAARSSRGGTDPDAGIPPADIPPVGPNNGFPPDFEPADNTLTEEITGRVNDIITAHVKPALNTIQGQVQGIVDKITSELPNARSTFRNMVQPARAAHDEFVAGSEPVIDEIRRYAGEQIAYIVESAEEMTDPVARQKFIEEELAAVEEEIADVAEELAERGNQVGMTAAKQIQRMDASDIFENRLSMGGVSDPEFTFGENERLRTRQGVPYQRPTRGDRAKPFKTKKSAETWMKRLREAYPSANEDSFEVIENPNGEGFLIQLADQLQRDVLLEDEAVTFGLQNARTSARGNRDESRKVKLENKTTIDVPTLAFQGRKLDRGDQQSLAEAFAAITGRLLDRGIITDEDFVNMSRVFEKHFPRDLQLANVRMVAERQAAIDRGDFKPTGPTGNTRTERSTEAQRDLGVLPVEAQIEVNKQVNSKLEDEAAETQGINIGYNAAQMVLDLSDMTKQELIDLHKDGVIISSAIEDDKGFRYKTKNVGGRNPGRRIRREELLEETLAGMTAADVANTEVETVDDVKDREPEPPAGLDTEAQQQDRSRQEATKRNPKERDMPQQPYDPNAPRSNVASPELVALYDALENFDWFYDYSDDPRVAERGRQERAKLEKQVAQTEGGQELYDAFKDHMFSGEPWGTEKAPKPTRPTPGRKKGQKSPATPRDVMRAKQRARLDREEQRDKERARKRKPRKRKRKRAKLRTPSEKVATKRPGKSAKSRSRIWLPGLSKKNQTRAEQAIGELVEKVLQIIPNQQTEIRVINREAIRRMVAKNHPHAHLLEEALETLTTAAMRPGEPENGIPSYIIIPEIDVLMDSGVTRDAAEGFIPIALVHELGHYLHYETWESLSREGQDELIEAFKKDVASGKFKATEPLSIFIATIEGRGRPSMEANLFEFHEWMADQFVNWMTNRRQPKNALERFLEKVAIKIQKMWDVITAEPGRWGGSMLNETYGDFVDALAKRIRQPGFGNDRWFVGSVSRSRQWLDQGSNLGPMPNMHMFGEVEVQRFRRSLEEYPRIARSANKMIEWMRAAWYTAIAPSTSYMRTLSKKGITAADELVRMFNRQPHGQSKIGRSIRQNYHQAREQMQGVFMTRMREILKGISEQDLYNLGEQLRAMDGNAELSPPSLRGRAVRKLLDEIHAYAREAGLPVGKIPNYFPRMFNREKLIEDEQQVIEYLTRVYLGEMSAREQQTAPHRAEERARRTFNSLISQDADAEAALRELGRDPLATQAPTGGFMRTRTATDRFFGEYYNNDVEAVLANYINVVTKRAEYNRLLGQQATEDQVGGDALNRSQWDPRMKLKQLLRRAREQGATQDELMAMKNYVEANLGMYGRDDIPDGVRKTLATIVAYQNMRTLLFSVFASLPDAMGPSIRSGSMRASFKTLFNNINDIRQNDGSMAEIARTWGIISDAYNHHVLTEYVDNHYMPKGIRKWNDRFFKYTGLNWWTDFTRKAALAVGMDSIQNEALKAQTAPDERTRNRAKRFLGELGLTVDDVNRWVARGKPTWGSLTYNESNAENAASDRKVANAMVQFVDESILRPNPSQRPLLASHPAMMLVYHLKGFMYAIHDTILKRLVHNFKVAKTPAEIAAVFAPAVGMMLLTAVGLELRELVAGTRRTDKMDGWEYTWEVFERTGLPGLTQYAWDWDAATARGQSELAGLGGPALSQVGDLLSKPASQTIPKGIPVVAQLPWARDLLRSATPL